MDQKSDWDLRRRFSLEGGEKAFEKLVERHASKVTSQNSAHPMPWAESIADAGMRQRTMVRVTMVWSRRDPQELQDYVARGAFSEEEKRRLLKPEPQGESTPFPGWLGQPPREHFPPKAAGPQRH